MAKGPTVPKARPCKNSQCPYPAAPRKRYCHWHGLLRASSDEQAAAAQRRLNLRPEGDPISRVPKHEWPPGERWCAGCQSFVPLFYATGSRCKACSSLAAHAGRLTSTYGMTSEEYAHLLRRQGGRCAICGNTPRTIRMAVDHDHRTGENRGLLCKRCNHDLLGAGHDDVLVLWKAIGYLLYPPAQHAETPSRDDIARSLVARLDAHEAVRGR